MPAISEVSKVYLNALMDSLLESGWSWDGYLTFPLFNAVAAVGTASITFLRDEEHAQTNSAPGTLLPRPGFLYCVYSSKKLRMQPM